MALPEADAPLEAPPTPTILLLVRHAVTEQTGPMLSGRQGGIDLSETGREQAAAVGIRMARLPISCVYSSPIERTTQTAEHIAAHHGLAVLPLPGVLEADYGEWTGGRLEDLAVTPAWAVVQRAPSRARFPGGESIREMQARTVAALEEVIAEHHHETVVVVSHADPIKAAVAHFCGLHLDLFQRLVVSPASVTALDLGDGESGVTRLLTCNDTGGLATLVDGARRGSPPGGVAPTRPRAPQGHSEPPPGGPRG